MNNCKGKFIVLYGINNLGKTTQAEMLADRLNLRGQRTEYLKYPIYNLEPSGTILNNYLRQGNFYNLTPREAQIIYCLNRTQFEKKLIEKLEAGTNIIAEDYTGTGLAWGIGAGVDEQFLKYINSHLLKEDIAFLFDGERFKNAAENEHKHETDEELINKVRWAHLDLGQEYGWTKINANQSIEQIHNRLWQEVIKIIKPKMSTQKLAPDFKWLHEQQIINQKSPAAHRAEGQAKIINQKLIIQRLSPIAKLPTRARQSDAGLDLYSADYYSLFPGERAIIKTGIKMAIPDGFAGLIWDKGGIARDGIHTMAGVVDAGFRGEVTVNLINLSQDIYNIAPGQKVAQLLIQKIELPDVVEEDIIDATDRGEGCFGSTGMY
ncbi:dUTP diphosphatase [Candidatus Parcubacteria bacterium]|nr:dUTP diphosphatase [Patescibacteria group bacterium]MCG2690707.1 dUTP diphosphatase [Candidatus Parcubacteria bacterium]